MDYIGHIRYRDKIGSSEFSKTVAKRVDNYFVERNISKHANAEMYFKSVLAVTLWITTYYILLTFSFSPASLIAMYIGHGFAQLFMTYNLSHDANHGAYSKSPKVNDILSRTFDLVGISSYIWRLMHNDSHHSFINVPGTDTNLMGPDVLRFSPGVIRQPNHRYQHIYASFIYCFSTLHWVLFKDFHLFFSKSRFGNRTIVRHDRKDLVFLLATKAFYYCYMLVIPMWYLDVAWYYVVLGFLVMHFFIGFHIAFIFQPAHITEGATYIYPDSDGYIHNNYLRHSFDTTLDFARKVPFANWVLGCLNLHIVHHMYSEICHVHYPDLTEIIKSTAEEFGLTYHEIRTTIGAYIIHLRWLKALGQADDPSVRENDTVATRNTRRHFSAATEMESLD
ncbi:MAG: acyl-CoA desaturase [Candidatus Marinimicrobia bacterium]|nr:acyl-CoA desaturase [Candidatus Neomarinimicrobiota bacterium]